jgi:hypothetical protein
MCVKHVLYVHSSHVPVALPDVQGDTRDHPSRDNLQCNFRHAEHLSINPCCDDHRVVTYTSGGGIIPPPSSCERKVYVPIPYT